METNGTQPLDVLPAGGWSRIMDVKLPSSGAAGDSVALQPAAAASAGPGEIRHLGSPGLRVGVGISWPGTLCRKASKSCFHRSHRGWTPMTWPAGFWKAASIAACRSSCTKYPGCRNPRQTLRSESADTTAMTTVQPRAGSRGQALLITVPFLLEETGIQPPVQGGTAVDGQPRSFPFRVVHPIQEGVLPAFLIRQGNQLQSGGPAGSGQLPLDNRFLDGTAVDFNPSQTFPLPAQVPLDFLLEAGWPVHGHFPQGGSRFGDEGGQPQRQPAGFAPGGGCSPCMMAATSLTRWTDCSRSSWVSPGVAVVAAK